MNPDAPRHRREGWPWPPAPARAANLEEAEARVHATALAVARLSEELRIALRQLDDAQAEALALLEDAAVLEMDEAIARARLRPDF